MIKNSLFVSKRPYGEAAPTQTSTATKKLEPLLLEESGHVKEAVDTGNKVFLMFMLFGIGALMPWNMFLNISYDYYTSFKLLGENGTTTWPSKHFQNSMTIASQIPNLLFSIASIFLAAKGDLTRRMRVCVAVVQVVILVTIACVYVDTSSWTTTFYALTLFTIIVLNAANGLFQNSLFGLASSFPFKYTNAILIGQNFCGVFVTVLALITKAISDEIQLRVVLYFGLSSIVIIGCFVLLNLIKKTTFFRVYDVTEANAYEDFKKEITTWEDIRIAFSGSTSQFINIFLLFFVTLTCFPNITMYVRDYEPLTGNHTFIIQEKYFTDVVNFLNFNLFAFLGSLTANWIRVPGPNTIWIAVLVRFWFLFYFPLANYFPPTNAQGYARFIPVLFSSTWFFVFNVTIMAFSSGYLSSLIMMYAPRCHEEPRIQRMAGMIAAFFLVAGLVAGLLFSWPLRFIVAGF